ncbi:hypothetical protein J6590_039171 [Homalodisca vitripennis]|nr:hypothetical protein J6590_039171 [Homalodisca vitripennis]
MRAGRVKKCRNPPTSHGGQNNHQMASDLTALYCRNAMAANPNEGSFTFFKVQRRKLCFAHRLTVEKVTKWQPWKRRKPLTRMFPANSAAERLIEKVTKATLEAEKTADTNVSRQLCCGATESLALNILWREQSFCKGGCGTKWGLPLWNSPESQFRYHVPLTNINKSSLTQHPGSKKHLHCQNQPDKLIILVVLQTNNALPKLMTISTRHQAGRSRPL